MFDAHTHLQDLRLTACIDQVIEHAVVAGITGVCCCGTSPADWPGTGEFAARRVPFSVVPAFGIHPWFVDTLSDDTLAELEQWLRHFPNAAVGEIGLDGLRKPCDTHLQIEAFERQLALAIDLHRPVILHGARAWDPLLTHLRPYADRLNGILIHGFSASLQLLRQFLDLGARISFGGPVCNPQSTRIRQAAQAVPSDRLLVETDAPDMFPFGGVSACCQGESRPLNQPANLYFVLQALAEIRGLPLQTLAEITSRNARKLLSFAQAEERE